MRFHPALYQNYRQAANDDILPLSKPIKTTDGKMISELPIPKGMKIILSIAAYNRYSSMIPVVFVGGLTRSYFLRNTEIFGGDAHVYNPERWFRKCGKKGPTLGVYGNL